MRLSTRAVFLAVVGCAALALPMAAQDEPDIEAFREMVLATLEDPGPLYMELRQDTVVMEQPQEQQTEYIWMRSLEAFRIERPIGNMTVVYLDDDLKAYQGASGVMLHVSAEVAQTLGDERHVLFREAGVGGPPVVVGGLRACVPRLAPAGEDAIGECECWVLSVHEDDLPAWAATMDSGGGEMAIKESRIAFEKDTAMFRGFYADLTLTQDNGIEVPVQLAVTFPVMEEREEIPDELLKLDVPAGTTIIEWAEDDEPADVYERYTQAMRNAPAQ